MKETSVHIKNVMELNSSVFTRLRFFYGFPGAKTFRDLRETVLC